jgi:phosphatidylglycerol:prolipoprotein diacylglycerol transferase
MLTLAAWLHDLDPFVFRITPTFGVRWYGLSYIAGFMAAWWILARLARRGLILVKPEAVGDLIIAVIFGTLVGGRLGYCVFYRPELLWSFTSSPPWWGVLALHEGGMASHGGMVGIVLACWWFGRKRGLPMWHTHDCMSLVAPIGILFGRIANFINGELLGRIVSPPGTPGPWWSVRFPQELIEGHAPALSQTQQEAMGTLLLRAAQPGDDAERAVRRVIEMVQHGDKSVAAELSPLISSRHPSQLYQAFAEGVVVFVVLWIIWARPRRPGVVTAWFLIVYGVGRVLTEFIRLPDAHLAVQRIAGLSRGQWLSVVMVVAGFALLAWVRRGTGPLIGGWAVPKEQARG